MPLFRCIAVLLLLAWSGWADLVMLRDGARKAIVVRVKPSSRSGQAGSLAPGEQANLLETVKTWRKVKLGNGAIGFVSSRATQVVALAPAPVAESAVFTLDAVDVGTGLGLLVRGPDFALVYDAGSNDDTARGEGNRMLAFIRAVAPDLKTLDGVILSHPHRDHVELLPDLFGAYRVLSVWDSGRVNDICGYRAFLTAIRDEPGVAYHNALQDFGTQGFSFAAGNCYGHDVPAEVVQLKVSSRIDNQPIPLGTSASMTILHADGKKFASPNDNSVVVRLDLGQTRILLMGDAQAGDRELPSATPVPGSIEGTLLACCAADLRADVLVAGHHGSKTSSRKAFLDAVKASVFLVSAGPTKYSGVTLPDAEVIAELTARGRVFRTDVDDAACVVNPAKIGPDHDGQPGGCDNVRVVIPAVGGPQVSYWRGKD